MKIFLIVAAVMCLVNANIVCAAEITVNANNIVRTSAKGVVGINLNYLRDHDSNRAVGAHKLVKVLKKMNPGFLRYPGGEKSDFYLWSSPPFKSSNPVVLGSYKAIAGKRLDFMDYSKIIKSTGAHSYIVVAYDSEARTGVNKDKFLLNAVTWIKYARKKHINIEYCEIGNENWNNQTASPEEMAEIVAEFSQEIKKVYPSVKIGASGNNKNWWSRFLPTAAPYLDFISLSVYNAWGWKSYSHYTSGKANLVAGIDEAIAAVNSLSEPHSKRIEVIVAETNSKDYTEQGWPDDNSLGHLLVTCDTMGQALLRPKLTGIMLWGTRWIDDHEAYKSIWYGLGPKNEICTSGMSVYLWGNYTLDNMVECTSDTDKVVAYATKSADSTKINLIIINKATEAQGVPATIKLDSADSFTVSDIRVLTGKNEADIKPEWSVLTSSADADMANYSIDLKPTSITVVCLGKK